MAHQNWDGVDSRCIRAAKMLGFLDVGISRTGPVIWVKVGSQKVSLFVASPPAQAAHPLLGSTHEPLKSRWPQSRRRQSQRGWVQRARNCYRNLSWLPPSTLPPGSSHTILPACDCFTQHSLSWLWSSCGRGRALPPIPCHCRDMDTAVALGPFSLLTKRCQQRALVPRAQLPALHTR